MCQTDLKLKNNPIFILDYISRTMAKCSSIFKKLLNHKKRLHFIMNAFLLSIKRLFRLSKWASFVSGKHFLAIDIKPFWRFSDIQMIIFIIFEDLSKHVMHLFLPEKYSHVDKHYTRNIYKSTLTVIELLQQ
jgi:hypothetical protein